MQDLQLIGVHEDGEHLLLSGADDERFKLPIDEAMRTAILRDRPHFGRQKIEAEGGLRPRDVQALIRAGASAEDAAVRAGWSVEKVHRYEGPILAEREHVAGLAQLARLRTRTASFISGSAPTLSERVTERLRARDVEMTEASWDSWRNEGGPWTVVLTFAAGGRQRQASWSFDLADRTVSAVDDEARWLSEEVRETEGPIPTLQLRPALGRDSRVYDVEAEGGMHPAAHDERSDDPLDLMTAMRKRSTARGRRKTGGRSASGGSTKDTTTVPSPERDVPKQAQPLAEQDYAARDAQGRPAVTPAARHREAPADAPTSNDSPQITTLPTVVPGNEAGGPQPEPAVAVSGGSSSQKRSSKTGDSIPESAEVSAKQAEPKARPKRPAREGTRKPGRPSVPAWDQIMFGSRPDVNRSSS